MPKLEFTVQWEEQTLKQISSWYSVGQEERQSTEWEEEAAGVGRY